MLGNTRSKVVGLVSALAAGSLLFYLGLRLVAPDRGGRSATPASTKEPSAEKDNGHEAKMLGEALRKKPQHAPVLFRMAQLSEEAGDYAKAAEHLREILRHEPNNQEAQLELGKVLYQLGDVAGALEHTQAILKVSPDHPDALYNLGAIYGNLGNGRLAREHWNRLLAVSPQSESAMRARKMLSQLPAESQPSGEQHAGRTTKDIPGQ